MFAHPSRARATGLLEQLHLDAPVLDEPHRLSSGQVLSTLGSPCDGLATGLAAWALDRGLAPAADASGVSGLVSRWRSALCLSNDERAELDDILENLAALEGDWADWPVSRQKRLAGAPTPAFARARLLLEARNPSLAAAVGERVEALARTPSGLRPVPLVGGDDLVVLGYPPGPRFKVILDGVYDAQLEDRVRDREEALGLARELAGGSGV
jgi:poly(A) polymerase